MANMNSASTLEDINEGIAKFLAIEELDPKYACFMANGIFSTLLAEYVEPQKATIEAQEAEIKKLRDLLVKANNVFNMLWDEVAPFELPVEKEIRDIILKIDAALKGE